MNSTSTQQDLQTVVGELLCDGQLRKHYKEANRTVRSVQRITHHGWIHISMVHQVAHTLGPILGLSLEDTPVRGLSQEGASEHRSEQLNEPLNEPLIVELACLLHDIGLSRGRPHHARNGPNMVEGILSARGVDPQIIEIVRLLVRWHRAEDFLWLVEHILPNASYIYEQLQAGRQLSQLVQPNDPDEDPNEQEVADFIRLQQSGIPMIKMLAVLLVADLVDIGRSRVRGARQETFFRHLRESLRKKRTTLEDILKKRRIVYSEFDLANFAITSMEVILQDAQDQTVVRLVIQKEKPQSSDRRAQRVSSPISQCYTGLFAWARQFARLEETTARAAALRQSSTWATIESKNGEPPTRLILRGELDREVCSSGRVEEIKRDYIGALVAAVNLLGLHPVAEIRSSLEY